MSVKRRVQRVDKKARVTEYHIVVAPGLDEVSRVEEAEKRNAATKAAHDAAVASYRAEHPEASDMDVYVVLSELENRP